jgi:hypothetical protein
MYKGSTRTEKAFLTTSTVSAVAAGISLAGNQLTGMALLMAATVALVVTAVTSAFVAVVVIARSKPNINMPSADTMPVIGFERLVDDSDADALAAVLATR